MGKFNIKAVVISIVGIVVWLLIYAGLHSTIKLIPSSACNIFLLGLSALIASRISWMLYEGKVDEELDDELAIDLDLWLKGLLTYIFFLAIIEPFSLSKPMYIKVIIGFIEVTVALVIYSFCRRVRKVKVKKLSK